MPEPRADLLNPPGRPCDCTSCTARFAPYAHVGDYDPALVAARHHWNSPEPEETRP